MRTRQCTVRCTLSVEPLIWCCERPCHDSCPGSCDSQYAVYTAGSNVQYEILKVQVHTTAARKESPWTASSRPTRYVNRVFAAPRPAYSTCTPDSHTSARRTPARTRTRPYGSRPGASSPGAPSRTSHGHAARPRRPRTAIARATAPSPARATHAAPRRHAREGSPMATAPPQATAKPPPSRPPPWPRR